MHNVPQSHPGDAWTSSFVSVPPRASESLPGLTRHMTLALDIDRTSNEPRILYFLSAGVVAFVTCAAGTSPAGYQPIALLENAQIQTGSLSQNFGNERRTTITIPTALSELRRRAALTWDDLSKLFGVSRRAVHLWASGERLSAANDAKVRGLYTKVRDHSSVHPHQLRQELLSQSQIAPVEERSARGTFVHAAILESSSAPLESQSAVTKRYPRRKQRVI